MMGALILCIINSYNVIQGRKIDELIDFDVCPRRAKGQ